MFQNQSHDFIKPFEHIKTTKPKGSVFALDYYTQGSCSQGQLIPIYQELCLPADKFNIGVQAVIRLLPMVSPAMTDIQVYTHFFYVPLRLLWDNTKDDCWTSFINMSAPNEKTPVLPLWDTNWDGTADTYPDNSIGSLWDYFGFPVDINLSTIDKESFPTDFLRRAYNMIYNEFYRDQNLIDEVKLTNDKILRRAWQKDYFTSCLPWQQAGVAPTFPVSGTTSAVFKLMGTGVAYGEGNVSAWQLSDGTSWLATDSQSNAKAGTKWLNDNVVDLANATTFNVSDLRLGIQIQEWLELNARGGRRYPEYLQSHFGTRPSDSTLQRPHYIGGSKSPVMIDEVKQNAPPTSDSPTPQGNLAGHGITAQDNYIGEIESKEWGLVIGLMSIMPKAVYSQGIPRKWTQRSPFDFYDPLFANLSEQPVYCREIFVSDRDANGNSTVFGYQGRWDELRSNQNMVCGQMRKTLAYWTQQRVFDPAKPPVLNQDFIDCNPAQTIFVDTSANANNFIYTIQNLVRAFRPIPAMSDPSICNGL